RVPLQLPREWLCGLGPKEGQAFGMLRAQSAPSKRRLSQVWLKLKSYRSRLALQQNNVISSEEYASGCCRLAGAVGNSAGEFVAIDVRDADHVHWRKWSFDAKDTGRKQPGFASRNRALRARVNHDATAYRGCIRKPAPFPLHPARGQKNSSFWLSCKNAWKRFGTVAICDYRYATTIHGNFGRFKFRYHAAPSGLRRPARYSSQLRSHLRNQRDQLWANS